MNTRLKLLADEQSKFRWDVIVVGAGMGGSMITGPLAARGLKVLVLEYGQAQEPTEKRHFLRKLFNLIVVRDRSETRSLQGYWPHRVRAQFGRRTRDFYTGLGTGPGGSSAIYSASLERFEPDDFLGIDGHDAPGAMSTKWPINYAIIKRFYADAERLLRVCGSNDPRGNYDDAELAAPPHISPRDWSIFSSLSRLGLKPYRSHVGIQYKPGCGECGGVVCQRRCKMNGFTAVLEPALAGGNVTLITQCRAVRLEMHGTSATGVIIESEGDDLCIRGRSIVLAAGALNTPGILLRSKSQIFPHGVGNDNDLVGRGLMLHGSDFFTLAGELQLDPVGPKKVLSCRDFYRHAGNRLGSFQSVGLDISSRNVSSFIEMWLEQKLGARGRVASIISMIVAPLLARYLHGGILFATILEDYPYPDNRVVVDHTSPSGFCIKYSRPAELKRRSILFRTVLREKLVKHKPRFLSGTGALNFGHPSGTCRAGSSPMNSVVDVDGKVWGTANLYVADSSYFPSSAGTNPSLTIAANALRIADVLADRLENASAAAQIA